MVCDSLAKPVHAPLGKQRCRNASQGFRSRSHWVPQPGVSPFTAAQPEVQSGCNDLLKFTHPQGSTGFQTAARAMERHGIMTACMTSWNKKGHIVAKQVKST